MRHDDLVLVLQIDALRHDYVNAVDAPFLHGMALEGEQGRVIPTFGFEPDAAYFAGLHPDEADGGAQYWLDPAGSPFRFTRLFPRFFNRLPRLPDRLLRRVVRFIAERRGSGLFHGVIAPTANIPLNLLHYFGFPLQHAPFDPAFVGGKGIFRILQDRGIPWFYHGFPYHRVDVAGVAARVIEELRPPVRFAFCHIGTLDGIGHRFGPSAGERRSAVRLVDGYVADMMKQLRQRFRSISLLAFGDHGMVDVKRRINALELMGVHRLLDGGDVLVFIDSTMIRVWASTPDILSNVAEKLSQSSIGRVLTKEDRRRYHIDYSHSKFGNLVFLANPGVLFSPSFYERWEAPRGMHGYAPEVLDQQSGYVIHADVLRLGVAHATPIDMRCIFPTVLRLLGCEQPSDLTVKSVV